MRALAEGFASTTRAPDSRNALLRDSISAFFSSSPNPLRAMETVGARAAFLGGFAAVFAGAGPADAVDLPADPPPCQALRFARCNFLRAAVSFSATAEASSARFRFGCCFLLPRSLFARASRRALSFARARATAFLAAFQFQAVAIQRSPQQPWKPRARVSASAAAFCFHALPSHALRAGPLSFARV